MKRLENKNSGGDKEENWKNAMEVEREKSIDTWSKSRNSELGEKSSADGFVHDCYR